MSDWTNLLQRYMLCGRGILFKRPLLFGRAGVVSQHWAMRTLLSGLVKLLTDARSCGDNNVGVGMAFMEPKTLIGCLA